MGAELKNIIGKEFVNSLKFAFLDSSQADVTLVCGGKQIKAHRPLLSIISPLLRNLICPVTCCSETFVILEGFEYEVVFKLLMLLYSGSSKGRDSEVSKMPNYCKELGIIPMENLVISMEKQLEAESQLAALEHEIIVSESESGSDSEDCIEIVYVSREGSASLSERKPDVNVATSEEPPRKKPRKSKKKGKKEHKKENEKAETVTSAQELNIPASVPASAASKTIRCFICHEEFPTKYRMMKHRKTHQGTTEQQTSLKCAICDKQYKTTRGLSQHLQEHFSSMSKMISLAGFNIPTAET